MARCHRLVIGTTSAVLLLTLTGCRARRVDSRRCESVVCPNRKRKREEDELLNEDEAPSRPSTDSNRADVHSRRVEVDSVTKTSASGGGSSEDEADRTVTMKSGPRARSTTNASTTSSLRAGVTSLLNRRKARWKLVSRTSSDGCRARSYTLGLESARIPCIDRSRIESSGYQISLLRSNCVCV